MLACEYGQNFASNKLNYKRHNSCQLVKELYKFEIKMILLIKYHRSCTLIRKKLSKSVGYQKIPLKLVTRYIETVTFIYHQLRSWSWCSQSQSSYRQHDITVRRQFIIYFQKTLMKGKAVRKRAGTTALLQYTRTPKKFIFQESKSIYAQTHQLKDSAYNLC